MSRGGWSLAGWSVAAMGACTIGGPGSPSAPDTSADGGTNGASTADGGAHGGASAGGHSPGGAGGSGGAGGAAPGAFTCTMTSTGAELHDAASTWVADYEDIDRCEQAVGNVGDGVICAYFTPGMPIGEKGWDEEGWRAMNVATGIGLGRRPHVSFQDCLDATRNARGGVVCTNTGVGYKSAHIDTNQWCGASSNLPYCLQASVAARDFFVCSFPSDGDGSGPGWVLTEIAGTTCNYLSSSMPLDACNALVPQP